MSGTSDGNDEFYEQLQMQQIYGQTNEGKDDYNDPYHFVDPSDGTVYEWDHDKKAWFPKITEDFLAMYQANYGVNTECDDTASDVQTESKLPKQPIEPAAEKPKESAEKPKESAEKQSAEKPEESAEKPNESREPLSEKNASKPKGEKRKADPGWFQVEEERNTNVYVTGLPPDFTFDEFVELMSKYGIIMRDPQTDEFKVKLYKDGDGNLKGDGLCCYLKKESVELALKLLEEYDIRGYKVHVEVAKFQLKGQYDASKKKKKSKDYKKKLSLQKKQLDWRPEKKFSSRLRHERVVIFKNMFHPKDFEEDALILNEIQEDLRTECEKFGKVKKIIIFDRHSEGVASVSFKEPEEGDLCIEALHGRWFGGRRISAETWDGVTDYKVEETASEREARIKGWESFLEESRVANENADTEKTVAASKELSDKDQIKDATPDGNKEPAVQETREEDKSKNEDGNQSTDSSLAGSDDETGEGDK